MSDTTRLSRFEAARVIAQRDFRAILFSRAFLFFLLGPLFPIIIGVLAGGIGGQVQRDANTRLVAVAMSEADTQALIAARARLAPQIGRALPELAMADAGTAPEVILREPGKNYVAVVGGTATSAGPRRLLTIGGSTLGNPTNQTGALASVEVFEL